MATWLVVFGNKLGLNGGNMMIGGIIGLVSCLMCAVPFLIIGIYDRDSKEPISFWSGDTTLKSKVKDVYGYNKEMSALYKKCAIAFLITGIVWIVSFIAGIILLSLDCTVGIYLMYRNYKRILKSYS